MLTNKVYRVTYTTGGTTFTVPFPFQLDTDLIVIHIDDAGVSETLVLGTAYSVLGAGVSTGGTVTLDTGIASGDTLVIERRVEATQENEYTEGDNFPAKSHENALDKLTMLCQQIAGDDTRSLYAPTADDEDISLELPTIAERASKIFGWDSDGSPIAVPVADLGSTSITGFGEGLSLLDGTTTCILYCTGIWTHHQKLTGDAKVYRFKDTGTSGEEWGIRSDGGKLEILKNTGTELSPTWTVVRAFDATGMLDSTGALVDYKAKVSSNDTTGAYLADKVLAWTGMDVVATNDGANETLLVGHDGSLKTTVTDDSPQYLNNVIVAGDNISVTETPSGSNKVLTLAAKIERLPIYLELSVGPAGTNSWADAGSFVVYMPKGYSTLILPVTFGIDGSYSSTATGYGRLRTSTNIYSNEITRTRGSGSTDTTENKVMTLSGLTPGADNTIYWQLKGSEYVSGYYAQPYGAIRHDYSPHLT